MDMTVTVPALVVALLAAIVTVLLHRWDRRHAQDAEHCPRPDTDVAAEGRAIAVARRPVPRRSVLAATGLGVLGGAGLLRWLGPRPATGTAWGAGRRLVTNDGDPIRPEDVPAGGVVTAWPEEAVGAESSAVMLVRLREVPRPPTRTEDVVDDTLVAYSRICTHAGCPVALYRDQDQALFCPCHQATFDAAAGATPVFGPASRPLPQLPLGVDGAGYLVATADFDVLPGPPGGGG